VGFNILFNSSAGAEAAKRRVLTATLNALAGGSPAVAGALAAVEGDARLSGAQIGVGNCVVGTSCACRHSRAGNTRRARSGGGGRAFTGTGAICYVLFMLVAPVRT
jgi:hypothetical protein